MQWLAQKAANFYKNGIQTLVVRYDLSHYIRENGVEMWSRENKIVKKNGLAFFKYQNGNYLKNTPRK